MLPVTLTNGTETFALDSLIEDDKGAVHGEDWRGCGYTRCETPTCDHPEVPAGMTADMNDICDYVQDHLDSIKGLLDEYMDGAQIDIAVAHTVYMKRRLDQLVGMLTDEE